MPATVGRPVFVNSPLTFSHSGLEVRSPRVAALYERIATNAMLVRWDVRNSGMSQRGGYERYCDDHDEGDDDERRNERDRDLRAGRISACSTPVA